MATAILLGLSLAELAADAAPESDQPAAASTDASSGDKAVSLDAFTVTGSHIRRLEGEGPAPVNDYSSDLIEGSGALTLGSFLQNLPFNSGSEQTINNPSGFGQGDYARGASTLNPRGLGPQRVLILIDGHRPVNFASPDSSGASVFDIDSVPAAVIESVEYLKDGASGIYGSDAITGVLNIKLKKNYNGLSTDVMVGDVAQSGGQGGDPMARSANLIAGGSVRGTTFLVDLNSQPSHSREYSGVSPWRTGVVDSGLVRRRS
jgi:outer membrane receptor protein involved in Fe transport